MKGRGRVGGEGKREAGNGVLSVPDSESFHGPCAAP